MILFKNLIHEFFRPVSLLDTMNGHICLTAGNNGRAIGPENREPFQRKGEKNVVAEI